MLPVLLVGADRTSVEILNLLNGTWEGRGLMISIDTERLQANTDPNHPFRWEPLVIRNVTGNMVVFAIGKQLFIGLVEDDKLTLTSPALLNSYVFRRNK